jgi:3-oxoacyl-[acyl-carrier protein] reductase
VGDVLDPATALERIARRGQQAVGMHVDVAVPSAADELNSFACKEFRQVDVVVNNAGIDAPEVDVLDLGDAERQRTIDVDLNGVFYCTRAALRRVVDQTSGAIINISSHLTWMGATGVSSAYNASKAGVLD